MSGFRCTVLFLKLDTGSAAIFSWLLCELLPAYLIKGRTFISSGGRLTKGDILIVKLDPKLKEQREKYTVKGETRPSTLHLCTGRGEGLQQCIVHWDRDPAPATPISLSGYLGINALIEKGLGQFCKCWEIKKATFTTQGDCSTKLPFIGATFHITEVKQRWIDYEVI